MADTAIKVENLSKLYQIGTQKSGSLRESIVNKWHRLTGKQASTSEDFWALKDVSFEIKQGEAVGVIGKNGAGKSTLLKIISRITEPTKGRIEINGRIASLLEVGTGFHPELSGRENIYLNGTILGMSRWEIKNKFDQIVDFSGVEKFIDTPVKFYSSGMYVRLAFSVASHIDPEILIIDEVLAVGDADFQKKCLGKMGEVADSGRTVLFVSHSMGAVNQLCKKAIFLKSGTLHMTGDVEIIVKEYLKSNTQNGKLDLLNVIGPLSNIIEFERISVNERDNGEINIAPSEEIKVILTGRCNRHSQFFKTSFSISCDNVRLFTIHDVEKPELLHKGYFTSEICIPAYLLRPGDYTISIGGHDTGSSGIGREWLSMPNVVSFSISEEWDQKNEFVNFGIINLPVKGKRVLHLSAASQND